LVWSPDGAYLACADREMRILLIDAKSGAITIADETSQGGSYNQVNSSFRFSPDGKWLAFAHLEENWNGTIHLYEIATKRNVAVTDAEMNCDSPAFDPEGKLLYFLADRDFDPRYVGANRYFAFDRYTKPTALALAKDVKSPFLDDNDQEGASDEDKK